MPDAGDIERADASAESDASRSPLGDAGSGNRDASHESAAPSDSGPPAYYWTPDHWQSATSIRCGADPVVPASTFVASDGCASIGFDAPDPATASEALDLALRTNLAAHVAARGPFAAYATLYTPAVGGCNPGVAEYVVVLTRGAP
jgi:hypothetical protein